MSWLHRLFEPPAIETWADSAQEHANRMERKRLSENHYLRAQAIGAWLLATLVAVNGGALTLEFADKSDAPAFVVGILLAIGAGFLSQQESQDRTGLHYVQSLLPENVTPNGREKEELWRWRGPAMRLAAKLLNWASLGAFVLGCVLMAGHHHTSTTPSGHGASSLRAR